MTREELEHIIRASADVTDQYEFVIVGSQSILGPVPHPEDVFTMSTEADIYPLHAPELAEKIEGALGCGVAFGLDGACAPPAGSGHQRPRGLLPGCGGHAAGRGIAKETERFNSAMGQGSQGQRHCVGQLLAMLSPTVGRLDGLLEAELSHLPLTV